MEQLGDKEKTEKVSPLRLEYTANMPELMEKLGCTLALSTYQAGKLVMISTDGNGKLIQLARNFQKPMGIAYLPDRLALATKYNITVFSSSSMLAKTYPAKPDTYDRLYLPRMQFITGDLHLHDLEWGKTGLFAVNTLFSCIMRTDSLYNFQPYWKPDFVSDLLPEDRCHLNGMAMQNGMPKYVTCFNGGNERRSWKANLPHGGKLIDIETNRIILDNIPMPHSPRLFGNRLLLLLSGTGQVVEVDTEAGTYKELIKLDGFVRGMDLHGEFLFVGLSRMREGKGPFNELEIAKNAKECGVEVIHLPTATRVGRMYYTAEVHELYDVKILPNARRVNILNTEREESRLAIQLKDGGFWATSPAKEELEKGE